MSENYEEQNELDLNEGSLRRGVEAVKDTVQSVRDRFRKLSPQERYEREVGREKRKAGRNRERDDETLRNILKTEKSVEKHGVLGGKAIKRMFNREEVEQIDEISQDLALRAHAKANDVTSRRWNDKFASADLADKGSQGMFYHSSSGEDAADQTAKRLRKHIKRKFGPEAAARAKRSEFGVVAPEHTTPKKKSFLNRLGLTKEGVEQMDEAKWRDEKLKGKTFMNPRAVNRAPKDRSEYYGGDPGELRGDEKIPLNRKGKPELSTDPLADRANLPKRTRGGQKFPRVGELKRAIMNKEEVEQQMDEAAVPGTKEHLAKLVGDYNDAAKRYHYARENGTGKEKKHLDNLRRAEAEIHNHYGPLRDGEGNTLRRARISSYDTSNPKKFANSWLAEEVEQMDEGAFDATKRAVRNKSNELIHDYDKVPDPTSVGNTLKGMYNVAKGLGGATVRGLATDARRAVRKVLRKEGVNEDMSVDTKDIIESIANQNRPKSDIKEMVYAVLSDRINGRLDECKAVIAENYFGQHEEYFGKK